LALEDVQNLDTLSSADQEKARAAFAAAQERAAAPKKRKTAEKGESTPKKAKKGKGSADIVIEKKSKRKVKDETGVEVDDDPIVQKYKAMTISQLKDYLRLNRALLAGTKGDIVPRCVDGEKNGRMMPCPVCSGKLRLSEKGTVVCGGTFDEDINQNIPCSYEAAPSDIKRGRWLVPGVDEAEDEDESAEAAANAIASEDQLAEVQTAFDLLDEGASPKDFAQKLVEVARKAGVNMPADDKVAIQRAGSSLIAHKNDDGKFDFVGAFKQLLRELGTAAAADKKKEAAEKARPRAKIGDNDLIAAVLDELGTLEGKLKESTHYVMKARALKKASIAVRLCDFKIKSGKQVSTGKQKLPGVGKGTGEIIDEVITTGACAHLEDLREKAKELGEA